MTPYGSRVTGDGTCQTDPILRKPIYAFTLRRFYAGPLGTGSVPGTVQNKANLSGVEWFLSAFAYKG